MPLRPAHSSILALSAILLASSACFVFAQDAQKTEETTELAPIVLKGKRVKSAVAETPLASETTREEIAKKDVDNLNDLGNTTEPGVSFVGASGSVNIRGLEEDRVLTLIDGVPIPYVSDPVRGYALGGSDSYDFSSLSAVDIVRGADSSRAGSGALGGAVVLRTLEPEDLISDGKDWGVVAKTTYDSSDRSFSGSVAGAKRVGDTSVLFQGSYKKGHETETKGDVGGYGSARTEANPEDFDRENVMFKIRRKLEGGHTIGLTAEHYNYDSTTDLRNQQGSTYRQDDYDDIDDTTRTRVSLDYRFQSESADSLIDSASATLYWQKLQKYGGVEAYRLSAPAGDYWRKSDYDDKSFGFTGWVKGGFETGSLSHEVTIGGNASLAKTTQYETGYDTCDTYTTAPFACSFYHNNQADMPEVWSTNLGIYADDKITFGDSNFSLTPGLRFDWFNYDTKETAGYENNDGYDGLPDGTSDYQVSPKVRASWQVRPDVELYAQWAVGFKAPSVTQMYLNYTNPGRYRTIGNPDLDPETSNGFEIGTNFGHEDFGGRLAGFYNRYRNFIDSDTTITSDFPMGSTEYFNRNRVRIYGIEANLHKSFDNGINLHGALSYAFGEDIDTGERLASVPPLKVVAGIGYQQEEWGTDLTVIGVSGVSDKSTANFKPAGYGIVNVTGWWEPAKLKGLRVQAGVYNLFDKEYYDALEVKDVNVTSASSNRAFYSEPGRTFKVSITKTF
jgi:hemoglobin/transferrin/lactoferrin receptor protein